MGILTKAHLIARKVWLPKLLTSPKPARALTTLKAITGQLYLAIMISQLFAARDWQRQVAGKKKRAH